jgi:hypothetical protein
VHKGLPVPDGYDTEGAVGKEFRIWGYTLPYLFWPQVFKSLIASAIPQCIVSLFRQEMQVIPVLFKDNKDLPMIVPFLPAEDC